MLRNLLLIGICATAHGDGDLRTYGVENLAQEAQIEASSTAGKVGAKYGIDSANDGNPNTWWASNSFPKYPVSIALTFPAPTTLDALAFVQAENPSIYTNWKTVSIEFSDGSSLDETFEDSAAPKLVRFERRTVEWLRIEILEPYDAKKHYVTLREVMAFNDSDRKVKIKMPPTVAWKNTDVTPGGRETHPCVYITLEDVARARQRLATEEWAQKWFARVRKTADEWAAKDDDWIASILPEHGACFAYGFTGCPICNARWGTWGGARCSFDNPGHVICSNGHVLPDAEHPDPGTGYVGPDGRIHYFVGSYNAWVIETLQFKALANLALAYTLTGEEKYAEKAVFILDRLADLYPSCDAGSWDYPSKPPSGRFCRPWYQVARVLVHYVDFYDQVSNSPAPDKPSVREGMTQRQNIEVNLLQNGATYCYTQSLRGGLNNGEADYVRGALAVGCCLDIPWYIHWAYDGPYGIITLVRNNVDRDGRYYETSAMYADHTRNLYLTFAEPLLNYRSEKYPEGINLYDDKQFQTFYVLPQLSFNCIGKTPRFGDSGPDAGRSFLPARLKNNFDYRLAERLYSRVSDPKDKARFASLLDYLTGGKVTQARTTQAEMPWVLFHGAESSEDEIGALDPSLERRISESEVFGQKGFVFLRSGEGADAQAALVRYGPTLNHGHHDDLNLNYYALGYEVTYDLGYGLGSTHTQVGWARQTASHNLVLVNETSQQANGSGTGGSLHLLADLPGLKLTEVSSDNSYVQQGVTTYRRLLALIGKGVQQYLVDIFRVVGGEQHDYLFHALGDEATFEGVTLGEPEDGSLAGPEFKWGAMQLNDGDMRGFPNKPYWRPPPGNGLGFLMNPQRARCEETWQATWPLPSDDAFVQLTMLGQPGTEVISAWAPGIYPRLPKTRLAIARRKAQDSPLGSTFIAVLAPYGVRVEGQRTDATQIERAGTVSGGALKYISSIGVLLHKAEKKGDELSWPFDAAEDGEYLIALDHYKSPSYGQVQLLIDGKEVGEPIGGKASGSVQAPLAKLGRLHLSAGSHTAALRFTGDDGAGHYWFGVRELWLIPSDLANSAEARSPIKAVLPVTCDDEAGPVKPAGVFVALDGDEGESDLILTAGDADKPRVYRQGDEEIVFQGRFAHVHFRQGKPSEIHLVGAKMLRVNGLEVVCNEAEYAGVVQAVDETRAIVDVASQVPEADRLSGQVVLFDNDRYSRNTAHRIARIEPHGEGSRIHLESPTLILGTGILEDDPDSDTEFTSLLAHEYARSDSRTGTQFFSGKLIRGEGFATNIERTKSGQMMRYTVDSTKGMTRGAEFVICDVQPGDSFTIPTTAYLSWEAGGDLEVRPPSTTGLKVSPAP